MAGGRSSGRRPWGRAGGRAGDRAAAVDGRLEADGVIADGETATRLDDDLRLPTDVEVIVVDDELPHPASKPTTQARPPVAARSRTSRCRPDHVTTSPTDCPSLSAPRRSPTHAGRADERPIAGRFGQDEATVLRLPALDTGQRARRQDIIVGPAASANHRQDIRIGYGNAAVMPASLTLEL